MTLNHFILGTLAFYQNKNEKEPEARLLYLIYLLYCGNSI